jgi:biopolymer transport protein ExbD
VDVLSVLLFFLLSVATLEKLGAHEVALPQQTTNFSQDSKLELKNLSLSLARDGLKLRGLLTPEKKQPEALSVELPLRQGVYDLERLQSELLRLKGSYKTDDAIILMVGDDVHFDWIVKVMDTVRERVVFADGAQQVTTLFPQMSLSDYLVDTQA